MLQFYSLTLGCLAWVGRTYCSCYGNSYLIHAVRAFRISKVLLWLLKGIAQFVNIGTRRQSVNALQALMAAPFSGASSPRARLCV